MTIIQMQNCGIKDSGHQVSVYVYLCNNYVYLFIINLKNINQLYLCERKHYI